MRNLHLNLRHCSLPEEKPRAEEESAAAPPFLQLFQTSGVEISSKQQAERIVHRYYRQECQGTAPNTSHTDVWCYQNLEQECLLCNLCVPFLFIRQGFLCLRGWSWPPGPPAQASLVLGSQTTSPQVVTLLSSSWLLSDQLNLLVYHCSRTAGIPQSRAPSTMGEALGLTSRTTKRGGGGEFSSTSGILVFV